MTIPKALTLACILSAATSLSSTLIAEEVASFPSLAATNLAGRSLSLPADFGAPAALVFVAFTMKQQSDIDAWKPFVDTTRGKRPSLAVWELPTIGSRYKFMRGVIEGGMRSGIKSQSARESTATLFLDAPVFAHDIGASMDEIAVLVVGPNGRIWGRARGIPSAEAEAAIEKALALAWLPGSGGR